MISREIRVSRMLVVVALVGMAAQAGMRAQANSEAEFKKIADAFSAAWAKGDGAAIAALHTKDGVRLSGTGEPAVVGTAAIEKAMTAALSGPYKGTTLSVTSNSYTRVTPDTYIGEGSYQLTGGSPPAGTPMRGQWMNTLVRQGGRWMIAAAAVMPAMK